MGRIWRSVPLPPAYEDRLVTTLMTEVFDANCTSLCATLHLQTVCNFVSGGGKVQGWNVAGRVAGTVLYKGYVEKMRKSERLFVCKPNDSTKSHPLPHHHYNFSFRFRNSLIHGGAWVSVVVKALRH